MNIDGQKIKFVNNVVYLGVSISSDLLYVMILILQDKRDIYIVQPISSISFFQMLN